MDINILEGNRLIAESPFGDCKIDSKEKIYKYVRNRESWALEGLRYHSSFDWIMDVVEKIEALDGGYRVYIMKGGGTIQYCRIKSTTKSFVDEYSSKSKIDAIWKGIISFIQWYNTKK